MTTTPKERSETQSSVHVWIVRSAEQVVDRTVQIVRDAGEGFRAGEVP